jgi:hypothetical protein
MTEDSKLSTPRFVPLRLASRWRRIAVLGFGLAWGIAIAVVATVHLAVALTIEYAYDPRGLRAFLRGPLYPLAYWVISASASIRSQVSALFRGPREKRVVWDIPRESRACEEPLDG